MGDFGPLFMEEKFIMAITPIQTWDNPWPEIAPIPEANLEFIRSRVAEYTRAAENNIFEGITTSQLGANSFSPVPGSIAWAQRDEQYQNMLHMLHTRTVNWNAPLRNFPMTDTEMQMLRPGVLETFAGISTATNRQGIEDELIQTRARHEIQQIADDRQISFRRNDCLIGHPVHYVKTRKFARKYQTEIILRPEDLNNTFRDRLYNGGIATFSFSRMDHMREVILFIDRVPSLAFGVDTYGREIHLREIFETPTGEREKLKRLFLRHMGFNCVRFGKNLRIEYQGGQIVDVPFGQGLSLRRDRGSRTIIGERRR